MPARRKPIENAPTIPMQVWLERAKAFVDAWPGKKPAAESDRRLMMEVSFMLALTPRAILAKPEPGPNGEPAPEGIAREFARCYASFPDLTIALLRLARAHGGYDDPQSDLSKWFRPKSDLQSKIQRWYCEHPVICIDGQPVITAQLSPEKLLAILEKEIGMIIKKSNVKTALLRLRR